MSASRNDVQSKLSLKEHCMQMALQIIELLVSLKAGNIVAMYLLTARFHSRHRVLIS